jgi:hypothetical protein
MEGQSIVKANTFTSIGIFSAFGQNNKVRDSYGCLRQFQFNKDITFRSNDFCVKSVLLKITISHFIGKELKDIEV